MKLPKCVFTALAGILLLPSLATAVTHQVNQVGLSFDPAVINIQVGDTVQWNWSVGSHTVTSGTNLSDPQVGLLFDTPLNSSAPTFSYTFTEAGSQDYFCRPHLSFGMTGSINIEAASPVPDVAAQFAVRLLPNAPNPFNPSTRITFELPADRAGPLAVKLSVFDLKGRLVSVLLDKSLDADRYSVPWDGRHLNGNPVSSGVYVYRLTAGGQTLSRTMTLTK